MFDYDWFHKGAFQKQQDEARSRCAARKFSELSPEQAAADSDCKAFRDELVVRNLIYLRDGFSYEVKHVADIGLTGHLTFECEPVDDNYKVGAFVVAVPYDDIVRVEAYAVHPSEKPDDMPMITGFRSAPEPRGAVPGPIDESK